MIAVGNTLCKVVTNITTTPYIRGHIIDGSSTFTFKINNSNVTVNVDSNGWWQYNPSINVTSLEDAFYIKQNIDIIDISLDLSKINDFNRAFYNCICLEKLTFNKSYKNTTVTRVNNFIHFDLIRDIDLSMFTFENLTSTWSMFNSSHIMRINLSNADFSNLTETTNMFNNCAYLKDLILKPNSIKMDMIIGNSSYLQKNSIINLINAAAANITYTLNTTPYSRCASGGVWHTDVQAAIDAKAQQGYTVTLISA